MNGPFGFFYPLPLSFLQVAPRCAKPRGCFTQVVTQADLSTYDTNCPGFSHLRCPLLPSMHWGKKRICWNGKKKFQFIPLQLRSSQLVIECCHGDAPTSYDTTIIFRFFLFRKPFSTLLIIKCRIDRTDFFPIFFNVIIYVLNN